jgi:SAM-dependent methyltransferase
VFGQRRIVPGNAWVEALKGKASMCTPACIGFGIRHLTPDEVRGTRVIEIGSRDVNGSLRPLIMSWGKPAEYVGVDIVEGPGVDIICTAEDLVDRFGKESFDLVISTEMLEHVRDWRKVVSNMKNLCRPGGTILVTTRSIGFPYHGYPYDYWRFQDEDMRNVFGDCRISTIENDPLAPGVFLKARKTGNFRENDLSAYCLYSIVARKKVRDLSERELRTFRLRYRVVNENVNRLKKLVKMLLRRA